MAKNPIKYRLKYVGGPDISTVRYLHVKDNDNDWYFYDETVDFLEQQIFGTTGEIQDIVLESVALFTIIFVSQPQINSVTGHLSTHRDNWVDWKDNFSFGDYYGNTPIFDVELGGQFHVRDGEFHTLNGIYRGFHNITSWSKDIFKEYKNGTDGDKPIVGLKQTFKDNTKLNSIAVGTLQFLPNIESIYQCWMNTNIGQIQNGTFAYQNSIMETEGAFENTPISSIPSRMIVIG